MKTKEELEKERNRCIEIVKSESGKFVSRWRDNTASESHIEIMVADIERRIQKER